MTERELQTETKAAISESVVRMALLAYADFPSGAIRIWTGIGTLYADGYEWQGVGSLLAVEDITETTDSAQNGLAVRLSGIPSELFNNIELANYQNREASLSMIVFDEDSQTIAAPEVLFSGLMDSDSVSDNGAEVSVTIMLESVLSDHLRPRVYRYTHEDQQTLYPDANDKGLEFVAALKQVQIRWGVA